MRNLSTGSNVYLKPSHTLTSDISIREIHEHIHKCRRELSLFKHSGWPKFCFHVMQLTGQAPVLFPLAWLPRSQEWNPLVKVLRRGVLKPFINGVLESCMYCLSRRPQVRAYADVLTSCSCLCSHRHPNQVCPSLCSSSARL